MGARVIYVHGTGDKVRPELLRSRWDNALFGRDTGETSLMAYWAPVRYEAPLPDDGAGDEVPPSVRDEPPEEFVARTLGEAWFESGGTAPEGPWTGEPGDPLGGWLRDMTYLADTMAASVASRRAVLRTLVKHTFKDTHAYFFGGAGDAVRDVVTAALDKAEDAPLVVVGHDLGSVVAYEVLAETGRETELFVTAGSPLGVAEVQDHLATRPAVPPGVRAWLNASDLRDPVALDHTVRPEYAPADRVTDVLVANDSADHHGIAAYLGDTRVGDACREVLERLG
ncbi:hypothetical protein AMK26_19605 [Streptomyces sp. CB03234]|uniref:hypothetical protein n=1 Tax=Streptomyces sp. (strain CB03234) TaxID=1703937 RepID=UPI00093E0DD3|nr:hypothetical protein [Streptomyces sp. CB03234]OKK03655.1 hypothetical protein AMK26_19605 [Streptomyces sp. CB03234]